MKIVFLSDDFPPQSFGGAGISTYDLAIGMKHAGHDVSVITTCRQKSEEGESEYNGLKIFKIHSNYPSKWRWYISLYNPHVVRKIEEILKKIRPDIVHVNNVHFYLSYHSIKIAKKYSGGVVWTSRDVMAFNFAKLQTKQYLENFDYHTTWRDHFAQAKKRWNPFRNFFIKKYLRCADQLFAVSDALKEALDKNGIHNVYVVHSGANLSEWQISDNETNAFKEKYNLKDKKVILFGGRLSGAKGSKEVIEVMSQVRKALPHAVLLVAASETLPNTEVPIISTGWINRHDMKAAYASADVVLLPSICFDSFPRIVLEAMAMGRPVIATHYGGAKEIVQDGITGYIVDPFNTKDMANKIVDLLKDEIKRKNFGVAGRERVRTHFNLDDKIKVYISHYKKILEEKK